MRDRHVVVFDPIDLARIANLGYYVNYDACEAYANIIELSHSKSVINYVTQDMFHGKHKNWIQLQTFADASYYNSNKKYYIMLQRRSVNFF